LRNAIIPLTNKNKLCWRPPQYAPTPYKLTFDVFTLKSGVRATCDVGYLCANFSLPGPVLDLGPYTTDRQTSDVRQSSDAHHRL